MFSLQSEYSISQHLTLLIIAFYHYESYYEYDYEYEYDCEYYYYNLE